MDAHAVKKISLNEISKVACLSVHHFKRSFRQLFGMSPHQYLIRKRIDKAEYLLCKTSLKVEDVSSITGFENTSSFIRLFRQHNGVTPGNFRVTAN
jgi:transcriptional regulator GlxA family with amidase domain